MARRGDRGPYRLGNVKIITIEENSREQYANMPPEGHVPPDVEKGGAALLALSP
jgi:hypothetical protein